MSAEILVPRSGNPEIKLTLMGDVGGLGKNGDVVAFALKPTDVRIEEELSTYIAGYSPFGFVADEVAPITLVDNEEDKYRVFHENNAFELVNVDASDQGQVNEIDPESSLDNYKTRVYAIGAFIPANTSDQARYNVKEATLTRMKNALALAREKRVFTLLTTSGSWNALNREAISAGSEWDDATPGDPILDLQEREEASWQATDLVVMDTKTIHRFVRNSFVKDHMRQWYGDGSPSAAEQKAVSATGIQRMKLAGFEQTIISAPAQYSLAGVKTSMLGDNCLVLRTGGPVDMNSIQTCKTFRLRGEASNGYLVREYELPGRGYRGGTMLVAGYAEVTKMVSNKVGGLITNCLT